VQLAEAPVSLDVALPPEVAQMALARGQRIALQFRKLNVLLA
jgi:hypothetical protein